MTSIPKPRYEPKRWVAGGLVAAALATVTVLPSTGWLVRQQGQALFSGPVFPNRTSDAQAQSSAREKEAARTRPDDFPVQLALALRQGAGAKENVGLTASQSAVDEASIKTTKDTWVPSAKLRALHVLEATYANQPSLYAAMLRDLSLGSVKLDHRTEQRDLEPPRTDAESRNAAPVVHANALREWERAAVQGEKLDPTNAFFPFLRAVGLFAQNRDAEAVAEIEKAATLPRFEDYVQDEATGGWTLVEAGQNGQHLSSVSRVAISAAILLPHYAVMRAATRLATVEAVRQEQAGNQDAGFAIRQSLVRLGAKMRTDSHFLIGSFVGEAIVATAQARPGGAPPLPTNGEDKGDVYALKVRQNYEAYLNRIGHPEEIAWVEHEAVARKEIRVITDKGLDKGASSIANLVSLMQLWFVGMALLANSFWMLLFGAAATRLAKTKRIQSGGRLHPGVAWGLGLSAVPIALIAAGNVFNVLSGSVQEVVVAALALGVPGLAAVGYLCRRDRVRATQPKHAAQNEANLTDAATAQKASRASGAVIVATMASFALMVGLLLWMSGGVSGYATTLNMLVGISTEESSVNGVNVAVVSLVALVAMGLVPALTWTTLAIRSRVRRVPVSVGTVRGFSRVALPVAAVLSLLYVGLIGVTCAREGEAQTAMHAMVAHEGRACADFAHLAWPTFAP